VIIRPATLSEQTLKKCFLGVDFKADILEIFDEVLRVPAIDNYIVSEYRRVRVISLTKRIDDECHQLEGETIAHRRNLPGRMVVPIAAKEHKASGGFEMFHKPFWKQVSH